MGTTSTLSCASPRRVLGLMADGVLLPTLEGAFECVFNVLALDCGLNRDAGSEPVSAQDDGRAG